MSIHFVDGKFCVNFLFLAGALRLKMYFVILLKMILFNSGVCVSQREAESEFISSRLLGCRPPAARCRGEPCDRVTSALLARLCLNKGKGSGGRRLAPPGHVFSDGEPFFLLVSVVFLNCNLEIFLLDSIDLMMKSRV